MKLFAVFAAYLTNSFLSFRNLRSVIYKLILSTLTFFPFIWYNLPQFNYKIKIGTSWKLISFRFIYEKCLLFKKNWYYKLLQMSHRLIQLEFWDVNQSKCIRLSLDFVSCAMVTITSTCIKMTKNILIQLSSFYFQHYFSCQYNQWEILRHFLCFALKNHYKLHFIKLFFWQLNHAICQVACRHRNSS